MRNRTLTALSGVVTVLAGLAHTVPGVFLARWVPEFPGWLPLIGTAGYTAVVYTHVANTIGPIATLGLAVGIGYYAGRHVDVAREYRRLARAVAVGSGAALAVAGVVLLAYGGWTGSVDGADVLMLVVGLVRWVATVTLPLVAGVLAGAAFVQFEGDEGSPGQPTRNETVAGAKREGEHALEAEDAEARTAD